MKKINIVLVFLSFFVLGCMEKVVMTERPISLPEDMMYQAQSTRTDENVSMIFVENSDGTDDGVKRLINSMQNKVMS